MSTLRVTAEQLTVHPHPNADALELAQVGLYRAVVAKGAYHDGEWAIYIPEAAVLPKELIEELGLTGRLAGKQANRVRAVRLRGELSQGIVCRPKQLAGVDLAAAHAQDRDFAEELGVTRWEPEVPTHMDGELIAAPDLLPWGDIENIKRYPGIFTPGEQVVATEKLHGSACLFTYLAEPGEGFVSSKSFGRRGLGLVEAASNLYWRAVRAHRVRQAAELLARRHGARRVGVFGEVFGFGVQDLGYGENARGEHPGYAVFDVALEIDGHVRRIDAAELPGELADTGLSMVPVVYSGGYDTDLLLNLAAGEETWSGKSLHLREGVVVRPARERPCAVLHGRRAIAKFISDAYLTRKGGTEYE